MCLRYMYDSVRFRHQPSNPDGRKQVVQEGDQRKHDILVGH